MDGAMRYQSSHMYVTLSRLSSLASHGAWYDIEGTEIFRDVILLFIVLGQSKASKEVIISRLMLNQGMPWKDSSKIERLNGLTCRVPSLLLDR